MIESFYPVLLDVIHRSLIVLHAHCNSNLNFDLDTDDEFMITGKLVS